MNLVICSIKDEKAEAFMRPFFAQSKAVAVREFSTIANDGEHPVSRHPRDYTLCLLGMWDERKGTIKAHEPITVINAFDVKVTEEPQGGLFDESPGGSE